MIIAGNNRIICTAQSTGDLQQVIDLQSKYHVSNYTDGNVPPDGFVTVRHSLEMLSRMNADAAQVIAKDGDKVIGYALVMLPVFSELIPVLKPMFALFDQLNYRGHKLNNFNYYVMGQVCIHEDYRGIGIFRQLYVHHKKLYSTQYDFVLTEVAVRNKHSLQAHAKTGFRIIHTYADIGEDWHILLWDWS